MVYGYFFYHVDEGLSVQRGMIKGYDIFVEDFFHKY
jgi:hypothetical protein